MTQVTDRLSALLETRLSSARAHLASPVRHPRMTVVVGRLLGVAFLVCFATGLYSHLLQDPLPWMRFVSQPADLYRWTQGIHVAAGLASIPLLLGKLWTVYPRLFVWPPASSVTVFLERASIAVLVASALLQLAIGVVNTYQWYPWPFSFRKAHYGLSWVIIGILAMHVAIKLPLIATHWRRQRANREPEARDEAARDKGEEADDGR